MPQFEVKLLAIGVAAVAHFFIGFLWYTPLFGKAWAKEMGFDTSQMRPTAGQMTKSLAMNLFGNLLLAYVLFHNMAAWNPESWGQGPSELSALENGAMAGIFTWLGFFLPVDLNLVSWEGKSWKLFAINTGYHLVSVTAVAMVLAFMW